MVSATVVVGGRVKLPPSVMLPAEKLPLTSRLTMVLAVLALVAALAALAPAATFAAVCPPTLETTVMPCVPVTSPLRLPEKLFAVVAVAALPLMLMAAVPNLNLLDSNPSTLHRFR